MTGIGGFITLILALIFVFGTPTFGLFIVFLPLIVGVLLDVLILLVFGSAVWRLFDR